MTWTGSADIRLRLRRMWDRGELLAGLMGEDNRFPLRLPLKQPDREELVARFDEVRNWVRDLQSMPRCRLETQQIRHRVLGVNSLPRGIWIDSLHDALSLIGKTRDAARFSEILDQTGQLPSLRPWLARRPLRALELAAVWPQMLALIDWILHHPRPGIYLRQVDLPGIHSKFIETHRGVLRELLDLALPPEAIDPEATGAAQFARRYGFRDKPLRLRLRILDPEQSPLRGGGAPDLTLDLPHAAGLDLDPRLVFITENEINFLAFPSTAGSVIIHGSGYGWEMLAGLPWLEQARIHYWGDIDTHGFAILDQLRKIYPQTRSLLMDRATLLAHRPQWGREEQQAQRDLSRLTAEEADLFQDLRDNRIQAQLRLEQERIGFAWVRQILGRL